MPLMSYLGAYPSRVVTFPTTQAQVALKLCRPKLLRFAASVRKTQTPKATKAAILNRSTSIAAVVPINQ